MSLRGLWVTRDDHATSAATLLYFRHFVVNGALPYDKESFVRRVGNAARDSAGLVHGEPEGLIVTVANDVLHITAFACLAADASPTLHAVELVEVSVARELLCDVLQFFSPSVLDASAKALPMRLAEVSSFIAFAAPFGDAATTTRLANVRSMVKQGFIEDDAPTAATAAAAAVAGSSVVAGAAAAPLSGSVRLPAWKPFLYRIGKKRLEFTVTEFVDSAQRGDDERCTTRGSGILYCRAELDGVPEVTLALRALRADGVSLPPTHTTATHISVSSATTTPPDDASAPAAQSTACKLVFAPPLGQFALAQYVFASCPKEAPFHAVYQMKESAPGTIRLLCQVRLAEHAARGTIEHCDVDLPFFNRGDIVDISGSPTSGSVGLMPSLRTLVWNVGTRFTGRQREAALSLTVYFASSGRAVSPALRRSFVGAESGATHANAGVVRALADRTRHVPDPDDEAFCTGLTAYARLSYKLSNCNVSSLSVDLAQTVIYPQQAAATDVRQEVVSRNCVVWNANGDWRHT
jgi:hypothetical protein